MPNRMDPARHVRKATYRQSPWSDRQAVPPNEMQSGKNSLVAALVWRRDELNDLGTHESPSHTAIAIKPTRESDIRYAVMLTSLFRHQSNMRHDRVPGDHFRREPYPSRRDPHGGSLRRGRGRTWTSSHAACRHVRACQPIKGSDGSSLAALGRRRVGRMWRRDVRLPSDSKSPRPVSRRGLNSCDVELMAVICPTCQIFLRDSRQRVLIQIPGPAVRACCWQPFREFWQLAARPLCWQRFREL